MIEQQVPRIRLKPHEYEEIMRKRALSLSYETTPLPRKIPKYLLLDIETLPCTVFVWGLFKQRIPHDNIVTDWCVLSWRAKWLNDTEVFGEILTSEEAKTQDDKRILQSVWKLMDDADVIIAHNGKNFDIRKLNARFWHHKILPPSPYAVLDTLKESQKVLGTTSHRLDYLGKYMVNKGKLDTDFELWIRCFHGEQEALDYMFKYNLEDILLLEEVYLELRPWIKNHPNYALYSEALESCCAGCGGHNLTERGIYVTPAGRFLAVRCNDCGSYMRYGHSDLTKEERKVLLRSVAG